MGFRHHPPKGQPVTCELCGAMVAPDLAQIHADRMHPRVPCEAVHAQAVYHPLGHAWIEQFRRPL